MPLYYNTSAPTQSTKNNINDIAVSYGIRDFLLHKNIQNPTRYPQISVTINGSPRGGEPVLDTMIGSGVVIQHPSVEEDSPLRVHNATLMNRFKDDSSLASELQQIDTIPYDTGFFPNSTSTNGIGSYPDSIDDTGLLAKTNDKDYRKKSTIKNLYLDATKQLDTADYISLQPAGFEQQLEGYADTYGYLNMRGSSSAGDILGTILGGQSLGLSTTGIIPNFDIRASLGGRVLGATGLLNDTKLGLIGGQQLAFALGNNAFFNLQKSSIGHVNLNVLDLVKGGALLKPDYSITVSSSKPVEYLQRLLGFELPFSQLESAGSIFSTESRSISNIERANSMLKNTGKGQVMALVSQFKANANGTGIGDSPIDSPFRSGYVPGYRIKNEFIINGNPRVYAYADKDGFVNNFVGSIDSANPIPKISYQRNLNEFGFISPDDDYSRSNIKKPTFSWTSNLSKGVNLTSSGVQLDTTNKTSLLAKTQKLFNSVGMKTIVSVKGEMNINPSQIQTAVVGGGISKGSAVKKDAVVGPQLNTAEATFCRSWTTYDRYDSVDNLIRHRGLNQDRDGNTVMGVDQWRRNTKGSVLDDNGFVKIAPYKGENLSRGAADPKKYMLSIENLAWAGTPSNGLLPYEKGPGDLVSGKFGRIMWFPPYDIVFSENNIGTWESTNFIGRGEPMYTYTNAERTGTLSFKIIIDHPSQMNGFVGSTGPLDDEIDSYFAGCKKIDGQWLKKLTTDEINVIENQDVITPVKATIEKEIPPPPFTVYFLNDVTEVNTEYENGDGIGIGTYITEPQTHNGKTYPSRTLVDGTDRGLNKQPISMNGVTYDGWIDAGFQTALKEYLKDKCPHCRIDIGGYASTQGWVDANAKLAQSRADNFYTWVQNNILYSTDEFFNERKNVVKGKGTVPGTGGVSTATDSPLAKSGRKIDIKFVFDPTLAAKKTVQETVVTKPETKTVKKEITNRYYTEASFFEKMAQDDPFIFDEIRQKIRYFHPAFHSTTPEGFNARLTFLNQCVRQGRTLSENNPTNLAFGPPPVCILRIGDFYNTKIVIDNIGYDFEPLVWDLNPEGVGVQPMIANVNISFKFIGGSALQGPINKLQNALSFNYYANAQVYDARADYIAVDEDNPTRTEFRKEVVPNYKIVDGLRSLTQKGDVQVGDTAIADKPTMNQTASNNATTSSSNGTQVAADPKVNDLSKVEFIRVTTDGGVIRPEITITDNAGLSTSYPFKAALYTDMGVALGEIGVDTVIAGELFQKYPFQTGYNLLEAGKTYAVRLNFDGESKTKTFVA